MKALRTLGFNIGYLALLTKKDVKPLSRWESGFSRGQIKALHHLGLKTNTVERKLANGGAITELLFSKSSRYLDFYTRRFHKTPVSKDRQTVMIEGLLFGYPGCCARNFAENGYTQNELVEKGQEILFHWACPGCRSTPSLLPYYQKTHQECRKLLDAQRPSVPHLVKKSLPIASLSFLCALTPLKARGQDSHWLPLGAEDLDGDYLTYSEEILLGTHLAYPAAEIPNGPEEALKFIAIINSLPETAADSCCYVQHNLTFGVENCQVCGEIVNMGYVTIHNPMRDISIDIPYVGLHYMEHGSFSFDGTVNSGRVDIKRLKQLLAHYDSDHFSIETSNDADADGLRDDYEDYFHTLINNADSNGNGLVDGAELAERFIGTLAKLPVVRWGEKLFKKTPYIEYTQMDGVENCDICGMAINMGTVSIVNPMQRREMTFPIVALHYLAHGRFAYKANWISGEVDPRQLSSILKNPTRVLHRIPVSDDGPFRLINHPNPFNENTQFEFTLPNAGYTALRVYNINGQLVRTILDEDLRAGPHLARWNGLDDSGDRVASGVYFSRLEHGGKTLSRKMLLLK